MLIYVSADKHSRSPEFYMVYAGDSQEGMHYVPDAVVGVVPGGTIIILMTQRRFAFVPSSAYYPIADASDIVELEELDVSDYEFAETGGKVVIIKK